MTKIKPFRSAALRGTSKQVEREQQTLYRALAGIDWDDISEEELRAVKEFFEQRHGHTVYTSDVSQAFKMDYARAAKIIQQLELDGQIVQVNQQGHA